MLTPGLSYWTTPWMWPLSSQSRTWQAMQSRPGAPLPDHRDLLEEQWPEELWRADLANPFREELVLRPLTEFQACLCVQTHPGLPRFQFSKWLSLKTCHLLKRKLAHPNKRAQVHSNLLNKKCVLWMRLCSYRNTSHLEIQSKSLDSGKTLLSKKVLLNKKWLSLMLPPYNRWQKPREWIWVWVLTILPRWSSTGVKLLSTSLTPQSLSAKLKRRKRNPRLTSLRLRLNCPG